MRGILITPVEIEGTDVFRKRRDPLLASVVDGFRRLTQTAANEGAIP
jgi:hypothetical protein